MITFILLSLLFGLVLYFCVFYKEDKLYKKISYDGLCVSFLFAFDIILICIMLINVFHISDKKICREYEFISAYVNVTDTIDKNVYDRQITAIDKMNRRLVREKNKVDNKWNILIPRAEFQTKKIIYWNPVIVERRGNGTVVTYRNKK